MKLERAAERFFLPLVTMCSAVFIAACGDGDASGPAGSGGSGGLMGTGGFGGTDGMSIEIVPIDDQTVERNLSEPRSVVVEVELTGADRSAFSVLLDSDNEFVVNDETFECATNPCEIEFTPFSDANGEARITIAVEAGGETFTTDFVVQTVPLLVRSADDGSPPSPDSFRGVLARAVDGDVVGFDVEGVFAQPQTITLVDQLTVPVDLTVEGPGPDSLSIEGGGNVRIFEIVGSSTVRIVGLALRQGMSEANGGAIAVSTGSTLLIEDCSIEDSSAVVAGGAISIDQGSLEIIDCDFRRNRATDGGALSLDGSASGRGLTFVENVAGSDGGAIAVESGSVLMLEDGELLANVAGTAGGAMRVAGATMLRAVAFTDNEADEGGALFVDENGVATITGGSTIRGNQASLSGGGVYVETDASLSMTGGELGGAIGQRDRNTAEAGGGMYTEGTVVLDSVDFTANVAAQSGGGIFQQRGRVDLLSSVFVVNEAGDLGGGMFVGGKVTSDSNTNFTGNMAGVEGGGMFVGGAGDISEVMARFAINSPDDIAP